MTSMLTSVKEPPHTACIILRSCVDVTAAPCSSRQKHSKGVSFSTWLHTQCCHGSLTLTSRNVPRAQRTTIQAAHMHQTHSLQLRIQQAMYTGRLRISVPFILLFTNKYPHNYAAGTQIAPSFDLQPHSCIQKPSCIPLRMHAHTRDQQDKPRHATRQSSDVWA